jgi:AAA family ATP:ADP antiporter
MSLIQRALSPVVELRKEEALTALLLFAYSFLAMMVWNAIKPLTRSQFIRDLGADNLPYVLLAAGLVIGILMAGYTWLLARLPSRWGLPIVQTGMAGLLVAFWFLFHTAAVWVSVAFYVLGLIFGLLLISQFWTVANLVYDARQAKRLFGFIGGGAPLGGMAGSALAALGASRFGSLDLLLISAATMLLSAAVTGWIIGRERVQMGDAAQTMADQARGVGFTEAVTLVRQSAHLKIIALVIGFASIGAAIIDQQLNMAAEANLGAEATDAITSFLGWIGVGMSAIGFVIQVWLTSRVHRYLGIGFALMILPVSLAISAVVMLSYAVLWAPALARVLDQSLRYTLDKTSREILFLPLPDAIKLKAKPFVDVTMDRVARAGAALLLIILVQPWGLHLDWQRISYASLTMVALWIVMAVRARRGYLAAFRQSIERQDLAPGELRLSGADLTTVETLVQELTHVDPRRVIYAIDLLESLGKRSLVTPLLLHHPSADVRERALRAMAGTGGDRRAEWLPWIKQLLGDPEPRVRAAAIAAVGAISHDDAAAVARDMTAERDPRLRATAATVLAVRTAPGDRELAEATLRELAGDGSEEGHAARREVALALGGIPESRFCRLLIPLLHDPMPDVVEAALQSVRAIGPAEPRFIHELVPLLRHRELKGRAREVLMGFGEPAIDVLASWLHDRSRDVLVRRHIPSTLARIRSQRSADLLVAALADPDGFIRFKAIAGLERLRQSDPAIQVPRAPIEAQTLSEADAYYRRLSMYGNLFERGGLPRDSLLGLALSQKMARAKGRIYRLLSLIYPWQDIAATRWALERGDTRARSSASEYLDNLLAGELRKRLMPVVEDLPLDEKVRRAHALLRTRPRAVEETLLELINDDDQVVSAAAIEMVWRARIWTLGADIEHVLAHRDVGDAYARDAALWVLAERAASAEPSPRAIDRLPTAEVADRLRTLPLFASVSVDELFRMAGAARQVRHAPGTTLVAKGLPPAVVHLLVDGMVAADGGGAPRTIVSPAALGLTEALQGIPMQETLRATGSAISLALAADELRQLLTDNMDLAGGLFATLDGQVLAPIEQLAASSGPGEIEELAEDGVAAVEKVVILERVPVFAGLTAEDICHLAEIARTTPLRMGAPLFATSAAPAIWIVVSGEIALEGDGGTPLAVTAGCAAGIPATLSGHTLGRAVRVVREGVALRIEREDLFELFAERPTLLRQLLTNVFSIGEPRLETVHAGAGR